MLKVKKKCCGKCLFSSNKIVDEQRKEQTLHHCAQDDTYFVCHEGTIKGEDICCRAFFEQHTCQMIRIAQRLGMIEFVE